MDLWDSLDAPASSAAELIEGLSATWQMIANALTRWAQASLDDVIEHTTTPLDLPVGYLERH